MKNRTATVMVTAGPERFGVFAPDSSRKRELLSHLPLLYAVRLADGVIKIGWSEHLWRRGHKYGKHEVLAVKFHQTLADERVVHEALRPFRARGHEYYHPTPEVWAVVNEWRDAVGQEPIAA